MESPRFTAPRGYLLMNALSTAMIVAGVGLAWDGLLLAAAGLLLALIEFKEMRRLNPWLMPEQGNPAESPLLAPAPRRIARVSALTTGIAAGVALGAVQVTGDPIAALPSAALAALTEVFFSAQLRRALG